MTDENILDQAIAKIDDETLRLRIAREVELLRGSRRFGLVFDRHLPESVRLVNHPIRKGVRVARRDESTDRTWRVTGFTDRTRTTAILSGDGDDVAVTELVVVREFGEPVFPGLQSVERVANGPDNAPWHSVINGENYHVLQALRSTHRSKVDLIYIDPPYNTGADDWIYSDRYVDASDRAKSSKWLSFMERRLLIARDLLASTGVLIVAIGDDEQHRLRMLLDQVLGAHNFIANITWQGGGSSLSRFHAGGVDYMLIYGRDVSALAEAKVRWTVEKDGLQDILDAGAQAWEKSGHDSAAASRLLSSWWGRNKSKYDPGLGEHVKIDSDGTVVVTSDLSNSLLRPNLRYPVTDPATGVVYEPPANGWAVKKEVMEELVRTNSVVFGERPRRKVPLIEMSRRSVVPSFNKSRNSASKHLSTILGSKDFPYPKNVEVVSRWIDIAAANKPDAVILDFFGGTGTTTEAVVQLNNKDGGTRQSILVTNNEVGAKRANALRRQGIRPGDEDWEIEGVYEKVTRPRVSTVVTGRRRDGSVFSSGLPANVEFFKLDYLDPGMVRRGREFAAIAPLLWLEAGATGERINEEPDSGWALTSQYGILFTVEAMAPFAQALADASKRDQAPRVVFIITDSPTEFQAAAERLPAGIDTVRLYESYLANYTINTDGSAR